MSTASKFLEFLRFLPPDWNTIATEAETLEQKLSDISVNLDSYKEKAFDTLNNIHAGLTFDNSTTSTGLKNFIREWNRYDTIKDVELNFPKLFSVPENFDPATGMADLLKEKIILLKPLLKALLEDDSTDPVKSNRVVELLNGTEGIIDIGVQFYANQGSADSRVATDLRKETITKIKPKVLELLDLFSGKWTTPSDYTDSQTTESPLEQVNSMVGVMTGSTRFTVGDYIQYPAFASKLKNAEASDSVSTFLKSEFTPATNTLLNDDAASPVALEEAIRTDLNNVIESGASIYDKADFSGVELRPETVELSNKANPTEIETTYLNRLLLEDAYPEELAKDPETIDQYIDWAETKKEAVYEELGTADPAASGDGGPDLMAQIRDVVPSLQNPDGVSLGSLTTQVKNILPPLPKEINDFFDALSTVGSNVEDELSNLLGPVFDSLPNVNLDLRDLWDKALLLIEFLGDNNVRISIKSTSATASVSAATTPSTTSSASFVPINSFTAPAPAETYPRATASSSTKSVTSTGTSNSLFQEIFGDSLDAAIEALTDEGLKALANDIRDNGLSAVFEGSLTTAFADGLKTKFTDEQKSNFPEVFGENATPEFSQIFEAFFEIKQTSFLEIFPSDPAAEQPRLSQVLDTCADTIVNSANALISALKAALDELINTVFNLLKLLIEIIDTIVLPTWINNLIRFVTGRDDLNPICLFMVLPYSTMKRLLGT